MGVWIETPLVEEPLLNLGVTPFVGVWIETDLENDKLFAYEKSHPSWVCGLKQNDGEPEIKAIGHTLRGCVD